MARTPPPDPAPVDLLDQLHKLAILRDEGALTAAEFEEQKAIVLGRPRPDQPSARP
jgi:hypothetical protein